MAVRTALNWRMTRDDTNMVIFESIDDPEGEFGVPGGAPAPRVPGPGPANAAIAPAAGAVVARPAVRARPAPSQAGAIIQAQVYGIDEEGLEDDHEDLNDLQVGQEVLVVRTSQQISIAVDLVEEVWKFVDQLDGENELRQQLDDELDADEFEVEFLKLQQELDVEGTDPEDVKNMLLQMGASGRAHTVNTALEVHQPGKTKLASLLQPTTHQEEQEYSTSKKRRLAVERDAPESSTEVPSP